MGKDKFSDRGYKQLFSHPGMVEDLLKSFVKEDFVKEIDFSTLKKLNSSYVNEKFIKRESDIIWEVKVKGQPAFIYLLIEFQSTVDRFMALRLLTYILLFYQDLCKRKKLTQLPSVFPIVLYNGDERWSAPLCLEELVESPYPSLARYVPHFKYYNIAENEFSAKSLDSLGNLVAKLFRLETCDIRNLSELSGLIEEILKILKQELSPELRRDFGLWLRKKLKKNDVDFEITDLDEMEVHPMLTTRLNQLKEEIRMQGREEGRLEGEQKGEQKGKLEGEQKGKLEGRIEGEIKGRLNALKLLLEAKFREDGRRLFRSIEKIKDIKTLDKLMRLAALENDLAKIRSSLKK